MKRKITRKKQGSDKKSLKFILLICSEKQRVVRDNAIVGKGNEKKEKKGKVGKGRE